MGVWLSKASKGCGKALVGWRAVAEGSRACGDVGSLSGTIQRLGKVLQGSEDAGWEGFWTGLGDLGQSAGRLVWHLPEP